MSLPVVALAATPGDAHRAAPLLGLLGRHARVVSWHHASAAVRRTVTAVVATGPDVLPGLPPVPTAVWADDDAALAVATAHAVRVVLTGDPERVTGGATYVPDRSIEVERWPVVPPLVRSRHRERQQLPEDLVLEVDDSLSEVDAATAMALAAAVVVPGPLLPLALALGSPVVTWAADAAALGLRAGIEVEVAEDAAEVDGLARALARDPFRAAARSAAGRRSAEARLDIGRPAAAAAEALGLVAAPTDRADRVDRRLHELWTPAPARIGHRARVALDGYDRVSPSSAAPPTGAPAVAGSSDPRPTDLEVVS